MANEPLELTGENVNRIFRDCLFTDEETAGKSQEDLLAEAATAEGVVLKVGFHRGRLQGYHAAIAEMLHQLPTEFQKDGGGGWSFLQACQRADGLQWAGHQTIDELLCLGIASKQAQIQLPRDMWSILPGGVPYFVVL